MANAKARGKSGAGKEDLVSAVAESSGLTKEKVRSLLDTIWEAIVSLSMQSGKVQLVNFGAFSIRKTKERQGHNPATQEPITIPAGYKMAFKVSKALNEKINAALKPTAAKHKHAHAGKPAAKAPVKAKAKGKRK